MVNRVDGEYPTDGDTGWEAIVRGEASGPHDLAALRLLVHLGRLGPDDAVRRPGTMAWRRASTIDGLFVTPRPVRNRRAVPALPEPVIRPPSAYAAEFPEAAPLPAPARPRPPWQFEAAGRQPRRGSWIRRHWQGELPLPVSFWIIGVPAAVAFNAIALLAGPLLAELRDTRLLLTALAAFYLVFLVITLWQVTGIWRSAARVRHQTTHLIGPAAAQLMACLGLAAMIGSLVLRAAPQLEDGRQQALGDPADGPRGIRILHDGSEIEISGVFARGLADSFAAALAKAPKARLIHLDSPGGRVGEALAIRDLIAQHGLETYVEHQCIAACTIAYAGGKTRWLGSDAVIGFHSAKFGGSDGPSASTAMAAAYTAAGIQHSFIQKAVETPAAAVWKPSADALISAGVVTDRAPADTFGIGGYGPAPTAESAIARLGQAEALAPLHKADGPRWAEIEQAYIRMVIQGDPPGAFNRLIHAHTLAAAIRLRTSLPDATALAIAPLLEREAEAFQAQDPEICWRYFFKGDIDPAAALTPELATLDASATSRILADGTDHPVPPPAAAEGRKLLAKALQGAKAHGLDPKRLNAALLQGKATHAAACQAFRDLLTLGDALPAADHAALLRFQLNGLPGGTVAK
jgi:hypothetical protein